MRKREGNARALHAGGRVRRGHSLGPEDWRQVIALVKERDGEEAWNSAKRFHARDLVWPDIGAMHEDRPVVAHAVPRHRRLNRPQCLLHRLVAIQMHVDLEGCRPMLVEGLEQHLVGDLRIAVKILIAPRRRHGERLRHPGQHWVAIKPELGTAQPHAIDVAAIHVWAYGAELLRRAAGLGAIGLTDAVGLLRYLVHLVVLGKDNKVDGQ